MTLSPTRELCPFLQKNSRKILSGDIYNLSAFRLFCCQNGLLYLFVFDYFFKKYSLSLFEVNWSRYD